MGGQRKDGPFTLYAAIGPSPVEDETGRTVASYVGITDDLGFSMEIHMSDHPGAWLGMMVEALRPVAYELLRAYNAEEMQDHVGRYGNVIAHDVLRSIASSVRKDEWQALARAREEREQVDG